MDLCVCVFVFLLTTSHVLLLYAHLLNECVIFHTVLFPFSFLKNLIMHTSMCKKFTVHRADNSGGFSRVGLLHGEPSG